MCIRDRVIDHVSLQFERGRKYAVVGRSGSGKSTLLKLLAGYYDSYAGRIVTDGESDRKTGAAWIHQEVFLFDDTIRNNITLYKPYDEDEIKRACHLAGLDDVLGRLPAGLDTEAAENGSRFPAARGSGSRWQEPYYTERIFFCWMKRPLPWTARLRNL